MSLLTFKVTGKSENQTKTVVKARNFTLIIDEPENLGGLDEGATPVEFTLASIAGCLTVVGNLVAKEMNIRINNLEMSVEGDMNPAKFMGKSDLERTGYQEIRVNIKVDSDADHSTLEKWVEMIEKRCPVSDNIMNPTPLIFNII